MPMSEHYYMSQNQPSIYLLRHSPLSDTCFDRPCLHRNRPPKCRICIAVSRLVTRLNNSHVLRELMFICLIMIALSGENLNVIIFILACR